MRRLAAALALVVPAAVALAASPAPAATAAKAPAFRTTLLAGSSGSSEPRVTVAPKDVRFLTTNAKNGDESIYRSTDGLTWTTTAKPGNQTLATTDVDVVSMPDGRVLTSELDYAGINFITHYSDDQGKTWVQSQGTTYADTDRQWFAVGPKDAATGKPRVYMLFHNLASGLLQHNMFVATSTDGGATFGPPIPVATPPQQDYLDLQCADSGGPSNIFVNQKTGQVYVVFGTRSSPVGGCAAQPVEINVVAANRVWVVTAQAKDTATPGAWTPSLAVDDTAAGKITGMQLAPGAVDDAGNVYVAYPESVHDYPDYNGAAIKVVHSTDNLKTWSKPLTVEAPGGVGHILPHIVAGEAGKIGLAYYTGAAGNLWYSDTAQVLDALSSAPHVTHTRLSDVVVEKGTASELMGACMQGQQATLNGFACGRSTDVNGIAADSCGNLIVTFPAQAGLATDATYASQQTSGTRLRGGVCGRAVVPPTVIKPVAQPPVAQPPASGGGGTLPTTGAPAGLAALALLLLLSAAAVRRRTRS
ncbi:MAG: repeat-like domain protein [Frankiales bacterium]|nr:repeat-like domain protein [Frankiales bacterium]